MSLNVRSDLRVEAVGDDLMVLDAAGGQVHSLSGELAEALRLVEACTAPSDIPSHLDDALASLIDKGIVVNGGWSRRKMLVAGGVGTAAFGGTLISMQLPAAAAASSCPGDDPGDDLATPVTYNTPGPTSFKTGGMVTMVTVNVWGAGGGGGDDNNSNAGGGGGGGGFIQTTITVSPCTVYTVTVGDGGGTRKGNDGLPGGDSSFAGVDLAVTAFGGQGGHLKPLLGGDNNGGAGGAAGTVTGGMASGTSAFSGGSGGKGADYIVVGGASGGGGGGSAGQISGGGNGGAGMNGDWNTTAPGGAGGAAGTGPPTGAAGGIGGLGSMSGDATAPGAPGGGGGGAGTNSGGDGNEPSSGAPGRVEIILA